MDDWILEQIDRWSDDAFEGGTEGLHGLASREFSGALTSDDLSLLFVNGNIVGTLGGTLAELDGHGTIHTAPDPAVPLLFSMRGSSEEIDRGFTDDTSFEEVHQSLDARGFSGYLRLSEYVLSGDYYVVYYGDRSFPVAFVGASERLYTGQEAMALATEEVGIYEVHQAAVDVTPLPDSG